MANVVWLTVHDDSGDSMEETLIRLRDAGHSVSVVAEQSLQDRDALVQLLGTAHLVVRVSDPAEIPTLVGLALTDDGADEEAVANGDDPYASAHLLAPAPSENELVQERRRRTVEYGYRVCGLWSGDMLDGHPRICVMAHGHHLSPHRDVEGTDFSAQVPAMELGVASRPARS